MRWIVAFLPCLAFVAGINTAMALDVGGRVLPLADDPEALQAAAVDAGVLPRADDPEALQKVVDQLSQTVSQLTAQMDVVLTKLSALGQDVAFSAHHSTDPFTVASHGTLIYDVVTNNIGGAYNPQTGFFTAPVTGTYAFFVTCMAQSSSTHEEVNIRLGGGTIIGVCYSWMGANYELGSALATVHMQAGQTVYVDLLQNTEDVRGYYWNSFHGFLLHADI